MDSFCIVKDHPLIVSYVDSLQRKNAEQLSFYPKCVFEREWQNGRIFLGLLNGEPCGYLYVGAAREDVKCHQVCIQYDARRRLYGAHLVQAMEEYANEFGAFSLTLRCGFDLDANQFWKEMGYSCIQVIDGGIRRMRKINIWRKNLSPELFLDSITEPAKGKTNSTIWKKNKQTGLMSAFNRGKKLKDYRVMILQKNQDLLNAPQIHTD